MSAIILPDTLVLRAAYFETEEDAQFFSRGKDQCTVTNHDQYLICKNNANGRVVGFFAGIKPVTEDAFKDILSRQIA